MLLVERAIAAREDEGRARIIRALAVRALVLSGRTQAQVARELGITQPAVSQLIKGASRVSALDPSEALAAAAPVIKDVAESLGFTDVAVFGSLARGQAGPESDIDLLVRPPEGAIVGDLERLRSILSTLLAREVDVVSYGGLKPEIDDDIRREAILL
jgi:Predicted nucleotidyltransferases